MKSGKKAAPAARRDKRFGAKNVAKPATQPTPPPAEPKTPREGTAKATVRGFISVVLKRAGLTITSPRRASDKARVYEARTSWGDGAGGKQVQR
jgi:hypothetical protein